MILSVVAIAGLVVIGMAIGMIFVDGKQKKDEQGLHVIYGRYINELKEDLEESRETIKRLNRRAQLAESALVKEKRHHANLRECLVKKLQNTYWEFGYFEAMGRHYKSCLFQFLSKEDQLAERKQGRAKREVGQIFVVDVDGNLKELRFENVINGEEVKFPKDELISCINHKHPYAKVRKAQ